MARGGKQSDVSRTAEHEILRDLLDISEGYFVKSKLLNLNFTIVHLSPIINAEILIPEETSVSGSDFTSDRLPLPTWLCLLHYILIASCLELLAIRYPSRPYD